ncbi:MAG: 2-amino-4-hydroxy-6-hydroxymethyldihydropteridine diphosphokinase [Waddliaceae bacterium]
MEPVYVALGSNVGNRKAMLMSALKQIRNIAGVDDVVCSNFYQTIPASSIPQERYLNAVCRFKSSGNPKGIFDELERIERMLGKCPKPKEAPRIIDLDLLFFGIESYRGHGLTIPHPRWLERLFVLIPLLDLTDEVSVPDSCSENGRRQVDLVEIVNRFSQREIKSATYYSHPGDFGVKS